MQYCTRCLYPANHPLNIIFDEDGVCSGCRIHEEKDNIDWKMKGSRLGSILNNYKNRSGNNYDCIIPVSGARDSYFIVHTIKNVYGLNPLLVTYNKHYNTEIGIRNLAYLRTIFDCDMLTMTVNPDTVKRINRATLRKMGSMYWHCIAGQTVFPVQIAVKFKIPLIVWGCHQGVDQVGMFSHHDEVEMTRKYRKEHDLMNFEAEDLVDIFDHVKEKDLVQYFYPSDREIERVGVRGIYLNNYIRWDTKAQHEKMIRLYDYETTSQYRTFDNYNDIDCFHYSDLHDYIKFIKYGYGKITDHCCREIRFGRLTRAQAIELTEEFQYRLPKSAEQFLDWMRMDYESLHYLIDQHRDQSIWDHNISDWSWNLRDTISNHSKEDERTEKAKLPLTGGCKFELTPSRKPGLKDDKYVLIGKGYVDQFPAKH
jgi:N-acetyl sugar amidotransferase